MMGESQVEYRNTRRTASGSGNSKCKGPGAGGSRGHVKNPRRPAREGGDEVTGWRDPGGGRAGAWTPQGGEATGSMVGMLKRSTRSLKHYTSDSAFCVHLPGSRATAFDVFRKEPRARELKQHRTSLFQTQPWRKGLSSPPRTPTSLAWDRLVCS